MFMMKEYYEAEDWRTLMFKKVWKIKSGYGAGASSVSYEEKTFIFSCFRVIAINHFSVFIDTHMFYQIG